MNTFESIKQQLIAKGVTFEEVTFTDEAISARTSDTSVDKNYDPNNSIKTLIISTKDGFKAVILRGSERIDQIKLKEIVGKWSVVDTKTLAEKFESLPGTICPLVLNLPILVDNQALTLKVWSIGAGANNRGINVKTQVALMHLKNYRVVAIKSA